MEDWFHNLKMITATYDSMNFFKQEVDDINDDVSAKFGDQKNITLQKGFQEYLFETKRTGKRYTTHDLIQQKLYELMNKKENKDFEIYVTGHSLGENFNGDGAHL